MEKKYFDRLLANRRKNLLDALVSAAGVLDEKTANMLAGSLRELRKLEKEVEAEIQRTTEKAGRPRV